MTTTHTDQYRQGDDRLDASGRLARPGVYVPPPAPDAIPAADASPAAGAAGGGIVVARAVLAFGLGLAGLIVAFANLDQLMVWSAAYGQVWVFLGFFLMMSVCGRLFWWGVDTIVKTAISPRGAGGDQ